MKGIYVQKGDTLDYTNTTDNAIEAGTVIIFPRGAAVAAAKIPSGEVGAVTLVGVFELPKATGEITLGSAVYYDGENDVCTGTATGNSYIGVAAAAATSTDTTVLVRLN